jgi:hypothetical protein
VVEEADCLAALRTVEAFQERLLIRMMGWLPLKK